MNKNIASILAILILPICFYYYLDKSQAVSASKINTTQPSIIKFSSDMCSECVKMEKVINKVFPKYEKKITLVNVPVQKPTKEVRNLIKEYNVTLVPTLIFKDTNGQTIKRVEGSMDDNSFENCLKRLINE
jgi:thioredoxin-related protein